MIIPLHKLHNFQGNKYVFTKAAMQSVEKIPNMKNYPDDDYNWKIIPNILKLALEEDIKYIYTEVEEI